MLLLECLEVEYPKAEVVVDVEVVGAVCVQRWRREREEGGQCV